MAVPYGPQALTEAAMELRQLEALRTIVATGSFAAVIVAAESAAA